MFGEAVGASAMLVLLDVPPLPPLDLVSSGRASDAAILGVLGVGLFLLARYFWRRGTNRALVVLPALSLFGLAVLGLDCQAWSRSREKARDERMRDEREWMARASATASAHGSALPPMISAKPAAGTGSER
jgi:hypothetical protein